MPKKAATTSPAASHVTMRGFAVSFIVAFLAIYTLYISAAITIPFVIAVFVWYLINALTRALGQLRPLSFVLPRELRLLLAILLLAGGIWFGYSIIAANAADVMKAAPLYQQKLSAFTAEAMQRVPKTYRPDVSDVVNDLNIAGLITALVRNFTGIAGKTLVVLFYTGFLLYEQRFFARKLKAITRTRANAEKARRILRNIDSQMQKYIGLKAAISVCTGLSTWLVLTAFGIDFAAFWGMMAFILNFIPYVGSMVAIVLPVVAAFVQLEGDLSQLAVVAAAVAGVQVFWGSIVDPRITGDSLNLSPIFIILSLGVWGMVWGVPGMFLAVPILAIFTATMAQFDSTHPLAILLTKTGRIDEGGQDGD